MATVIQIKGIVQGVGFRPYVWKLATSLGLSGFVRNDADGITIRIEGAETDRFIETLKTNPPPLSKITEFIVAEEQAEWSAISERAQNAPGGRMPPQFRIVESEEGTNKSVQISPDISICEDCERELLDPADRRYRYPFINCVNCGPRYSIINALPYDRPNTSMADFELCPDCAREYTDPSDRRYHAQPVACPACGPKLWFCSVGSASQSAHRADSTWEKQWKESIESGKIIAVKGVGGFHLACDALNADAVAELRRRKARENKPFALMVPDLEWVKETCELSDGEEKLLTSRERPIVLLKVKGSFQTLEHIAPNLGTLGVMLPYTPMHHLMFDVLKRPLVMTSANYSSEPMIHTNEDALKKLIGLADEFLLHDREIVNRCDDSVCAVYGGQTIILRPGRGMAPVSFPVSSIGRRDACDTEERGRRDACDTEEQGRRDACDTEEQGRRDACDTVPQASRLPCFNPLQAVNQSRRKNLSHWTQEHSTYFVTFRLADSIAQSRLNEYRELREKWKENHRPPYSEQEQHQFDLLFSRRINDWLDEGAGSCILRNPQIAEIVAETLGHFDGKRYVLDEWVVMPNHVHVLVTPLPGYKLSDILHSWKSFSAHQINKHRGGKGDVWQSESYDHIVRNQEELSRIRDYIRKNPEKAGVAALQGRRDACDTEEQGRRDACGTEEQGRRDACGTEERGRRDACGTEEQGRRDACDTEDQGRRDACDTVPQASRLPCVLGIGADMKNTFAVAHDGWITLSPYIGDLENPETQEILKTTVQRYLDCYEIKPERVVHDLHPDYFSTQIAEEISRAGMAVQHHHAHCIAAAVENGIQDRAIGIAFDGTGYGTDGTIWGGEVLEFDSQSFDRKFHLRPFALPGGERAVREPKRTLISMLSQLEQGKAGGTSAVRIAGVPPAEEKRIRIILESGINCPMTSSMGRLFDAVAVLLGACEKPTFDGEGPMILEAMADPKEQGTLPFEINGSELDWRPMFEELINNPYSITPAALAAKFHNTVIAMIFACVEKLPNGLPVVFSGGVFQNRRIVEGLKKHPAFDEHRMFFSSYPNDSAIALGQAAWGVMSAERLTAQHS